MSYRTVKKAYTRKFGKPVYVRDVTSTTVKVEPDNATYFKKTSTVNKDRSFYLMRKALYEGKPISQEDIEKLSTESAYEEPAMKLNADNHDWRLKLLLKSGYSGPVSV